MRLRQSTLGFLLNFLLGVAWAFVLIGALYSFFFYYRLSFFDGVIMTFIGALPGLFLVILLEYLIVGLERLDELKKQTELLEEISRQNQEILAGSTEEK
jgi:uncharacterized membrane protein YeaQ/YmgE (transglycosylase-associated protein family)